MEYARITDVSDYETVDHVYNLAVENDETYIANGIIVHNCRSTIILVGKGETAAEVQAGLTPRPAVEAKSKEQMDKQGIRTKGGNYRGASVTDRSPLKGTQTNATTYEGWLKDQPKYYQEKILGISATEEFRSGKSLSAVLKNRNSAINFDSLEEALN